MATFKIFRETALPSPLQANALYLIGPSGNPDLMEVIATDAAAAAKRHVINKTDIQAMIDAAVVSAGGTPSTIVADIAARNALALTQNAYVYVTDATGDPSVDSGGATYLWNSATSEYIKVNEAESMDLVLSWAALQGGPSSSPANIDAAVAAKHTHSNKTELDKLGENADGLLTYAGNQVKTEWGSTGW